jgi:hypothetical protein
MMADVASGGRGDTVRKASSGRIFELREGVWTDVAFVEGDPMITVQPFSSAWFDVIRAIPEIGTILRENERVLVAGRALSLQVSDVGVEDLTDEELHEVIDGFRGVNGG